MEGEHSVKRMRKKPLADGARDGRNTVYIGYFSVIRAERGLAARPDALCILLHTHELHGVCLQVCCPPIGRNVTRSVMVKASMWRGRGDGFIPTCRDKTGRLSSHDPLDKHQPYVCFVRVCFSLPRFTAVLEWPGSLHARPLPPRPCPNRVEEGRYLVVVTVRAAV